jgi:hypothetical protein
MKICFEDHWVERLARKKTAFVKTNAVLGVFMVL